MKAGRVTPRALWGAPTAHVVRPPQQEPACGPSTAGVPSQENTVKHEKQAESVEGVNRKEGQIIQLQ